MTRLIQFQRGEKIPLVKTYFVGPGGMPRSCRTTTRSSRRDTYSNYFPLIR